MPANGLTTPLTDGTWTRRVRTMLHSDVEVQADKLDREFEILDIMLSAEDRLSVEQVQLAVRQAKRVRAEATLLVRALAKLRDDLQP